MKIVATIASGPYGRHYSGTWKAQLREAQQVMTAEQWSSIIVPTMVLNGREGSYFTSPYNDPLVVELKVASALIRRLLIDSGSSVDIITWDCLKSSNTHKGISSL